MILFYFIHCFELSLHWLLASLLFLLFMDRIHGKVPLFLDHQFRITAAEIMETDIYQFAWRVIYKCSLFVADQMRKWKEFKLTNLLTPDVASCMCVRCHQVQNYGSVRNVERGAWSKEWGARSKEWGAWSKEWGVQSAERGGAKIEINAGD